MVDSEALVAPEAPVVRLENWLDKEPIAYVRPGDDTSDSDNDAYRVPFLSPRKRRRTFFTEKSKRNIEQAQKARLDELEEREDGDELGPGRPAHGEQVSGEAGGCDGVEQGDDEGAAAVLDLHRHQLQQGQRGGLFLLPHAAELLHARHHDQAVHPAGELVEPQGGDEGQQELGLGPQELHAHG